MEFEQKNSINKAFLELRVSPVDAITFMELNFDLKGACSDPQPHPPTFFKHREILIPKVESYLEGLMCEI